MNKDKYLEIAKKIEESKNILIVSHIGPDGDAIGSSIGLATLIKNNFSDKNIIYVVQHKVPDIYKFIPNSSEATTDNREVKISCFDLAISVDCATTDRMGYFENMYKKAKFTINLDHHATNPEYANINIVMNTVSSCGELLFNIAECLNWKISKDTAICLYCSILADTGAFRYSNTKAETLSVASKLVSYGADAHEIYNKCFESRPIEMIKIASYAMANAKFIKNNKIAYTIVTRDMLNKFNALDEHLEGIPEMLRQATSVEVAFIVKETLKKEAKFSFRSKTADVASVCAHFGGGGHTVAAGCILQSSIDEALKSVLPEVENLVEK